MLYLTTHSTHFIYGYMASDMVKDHSDSERGALAGTRNSFLCLNPTALLNLKRPSDEPVTP